MEGEPRRLQSGLDEWRRHGSRLGRQMQLYFASQSVREEGARERESFVNLQGVPLVSVFEH